MPRRGLFGFVIVALAFALHSTSGKAEERKHPDDRDGIEKVTVNPGTYTELRLDRPTLVYCNETGPHSLRILHNFCSCEGPNMTVDSFMSDGSKRSSGPYQWRDAGECQHMRYNHSLCRNR